MTDAIKRIREALADGPTAGPWTVMPASAGEQCVARINAWESVPPNGVELAHDTIDAAFIAACNPVNMAAILAHIDVQAAEIERLRADAERMDFMEINGLGCDSIGSLGFFVYHNGIQYHGTTARAAIDAAIGREA